MIRYFVLCMWLGHYIVDAGNLIVKGGLTAGTSGDFTIDEEDLEEVFEVTRSTIKQFDPSNKRSSYVTPTARAGSSGQKDQGFKYKTLTPKNTDDSKVYLPKPESIFVYNTEVSPNRFLDLDSHIRTEHTDELYSTVAKLENMVRVLGALLGLDFEVFGNALLYDREAWALIESIKAGSVPVYLPGDLYVGGEGEIDTRESTEVGQYCDAYTGTSNALSTSAWIQRHIFSNGGTPRVIGRDSTASRARWDTQTYAKSKRGTSADFQTGNWKNGESRPGSDVCN